MIELPAAWRQRAIVVDDRDDLGWLAEEEQETLRAFRREHRRREWACSRIAVKQLALELGITEDPRRLTIDRPNLVVNGTLTRWFVSLSHSATFAAAAIDQAPIGIDIQAVRDVNERTTHLFLRENENEEMVRCRLPYRLIHFWSAKEAEWKRQGGAIPTLKATPLNLISESEHGLLFDHVETLQVGDVVVALTR